MDAMANLAARGESLTEQLLNQWSFARGRARDRAPSARCIIAYVDRDGLLGADLETILDQNRNVPGVTLTLEKLERALREIQFWLDPPGIAARDVRECLLLQLDALEGEPEADRLGRRPPPHRRALRRPAPEPPAAHRPEGRDPARAGAAGHRADGRAEASPRARAGGRGGPAHHPRRGRRVRRGRRRVRRQRWPTACCPPCASRRATRRWPRTATSSAHARVRRQLRAQRQLADRVDQPAQAHAPARRQRGPGPAARVLRARLPVPQAAAHGRGRRAARHPRGHGQPGGGRQVDADAAGHGALAHVLLGRHAKPTPAAT